MKDDQLKGGELGLFEQVKVSSNVWMLPVLPERVLVDLDSNETLDDLQKLVAFRTSYQYISLKTKLLFAFED